MNAVRTGTQWVLGLNPAILTIAVALLLCTVAVAVGMPGYYAGMAHAAVDWFVAVWDATPGRLL